MESESHAVRGHVLGRGTGHILSEMLDKNVAQVLARISFPSERQCETTSWLKVKKLLGISAPGLEILRHISPGKLTLLVRIKETTCNVKNVLNVKAHS